MIAPQTAHESGKIVAALQPTTISRPLLEKSKSPPVPAILEKIAYCESHNRQFDKNGSVLHGEIDPHDIGKYQINLRYWGVEAKKLGYDLTTEEGNEAMAVELYNRFSTDPWSRSESCWAE